MAQLRIEHVEAAFACGVVGPIGVLVWRGEPTRECLERAMWAFDHATSDIAPCLGMLSVIEAGSPPPSPVHLPMLARRFDGLEHLCATVGVLEDRGPLARLLVDVASTIFVLRTRRGQPMKLCAGLEEGVAWLTRKLEPVADATLRRDALELVQHLRDELTRVGAASSPAL